MTVLRDNWQQTGWYRHRLPERYTNGIGSIYNKSRIKGREGQLLFKEDLVILSVLRRINFSFGKDFNGSAKRICKDRKFHNRTPGFFDRQGKREPVHPGQSYCCRVSACTRISWALTEEDRRLPASNSIRLIVLLLPVILSGHQYHGFSVPVFKKGNKRPDIVLIRGHGNIIHPCLVEQFIQFLLPFFSMHCDTLHANICWSYPPTFLHGFRHPLTLSGQPEEVRFRGYHIPRC